MRTLLAALLAWALLRASARAVDEPQALILFEQPALRPGLCAALRIQLTDLAEVRCRTGLTSTVLDARIAEAARIVAAEDARLGVLLEADPDPGRVRMLVVGAAPDRALLAVERVEARPEPDVDRSLALKVRETFEVARVIRAHRAEVRAVPALVPSESARTLAIAELGGGLMVGTALRGVGALALGVRGERASTWGELALIGRLPAAQNERGAPGRIEEREWSLGLAARAGWMRGVFSVGPACALSIVRASAEGVTSDGRRGSATVGLVRLSLGLDLRVLVWNGAAPVQLRFAPALELDPRAQRFALEDVPLLDLGRMRAILPLSLVISLPAGGRS